MGCNGSYDRTNSIVPKAKDLPSVSTAQIASSVNLSGKTIGRRIEDFRQKVKSDYLSENFSPQLYNIWNFARNNNEIPIKIISQII